MRKHTLVFWCLIFFPALALAQGGLRYTIQVLKFENNAGYRAQWDLGDAWGAVLTDKLNQMDRFIVLGEQDMRAAAMDEQDFAASGRTAGGNKTPQTGQMTPAQLIVKGVISAFDDGTSGGSAGASYKGVRVGLKGGTALISGTVYVVDTTTGMVLASNDFEAELKSKGIKLGLSKHGFNGDIGGFKKTPAGKVMAEACEKVADFLGEQVGRVAWSGTVVKGGDQNIIINRGTREGVSEGDVFRVGHTQEIRDPDTGELLDTDLTQSAVIKVTRVKERIAYCEKVEGTTPKTGESIFP